MWRIGELYRSWIKKSVIIIIAVENAPADMKNMKITSLIIFNNCQIVFKIGQSVDD